MRHVLFVAFKLLFERKRQTIISIIGVSIGVCAYIVMSSLMFGFQKFFIQQVIDIEPHIKVKPKESTNQNPHKELILGYKSEDKDKIMGWQDLIENFSKHEEIKGAAPHLLARGILKQGIKEKPVSIVGIDPAREAQASVIERFLRYKNLRELESNRLGVIPGILVAKSLGVNKKGETLLLVLPDGQTLDTKVVDFFDSGITNLDEVRVYIHIKTLQGILNKHGQANEIVFKIKDVNRAERLARELQQRTTYEVESWQKAYKNFLSIFKIQNTITFMIVFAILVVSSFGIFNIIMMTVLEKKRDTAILMALGFTPRDIMLTFLLKGLFIGALGSMIGVILGYGMQEYLETIRLDVEGLIRSKGFVLDRSIAHYIYGVVFSFFFSLIASIYPAYRASSLNPVDIFRSQ
ncbi:MAG: ABC transporter permease [Aquificaceae bacterium]|nr:ABC transporter permease [Aquificaceae bacterium]